MTSKDFAKQYKDPRWQRKRLEVMQRDEFKCRMCGSGENDGTPLNVHHSYYEHGKKPWEYPKNSLVTACEECHGNFHYWKNILLQEMARLTKSQFNGLVKFLYCADCPRTLDAIDKVSCFHDTLTADAIRLIDAAYACGTEDAS